MSVPHTPHRSSLAYPIAPHGWPATPETPTMAGAASPKSNVAARDVIQAIETNVVHAWTTFGRMVGADVRDGERVTCYRSGIPHPLHNRVVRCALSNEDADDQIERVLRWCGRRETPLTWLVSPSTCPADLGTRLAAHGLHHEETMPGMAIDLLDLLDLRDDDPVVAPPGLSVEAVHDAAALDQWMRPFAISFDLSTAAASAYTQGFARLGFGPDAPMRFYLGMLDGQAVATSALFLGGGTAGLYAVTTLPQARGRGVGSAMALAALREARGRGYRLATLQSSAMGLHVYQRLGFSQYCTLNAYVWPGTAGATTGKNHRRPRCTAAVAETTANRCPTLVRRGACAARRAVRW